MIYRSDKGFTLLELIVVLVILSIAAAIGTVSMNRAYEKGILKEQVLRAQGALRQARDAALIERMPVAFIANAAEGKFWLEKAGGPFGTARGLPRGITIGDETIVFMPKGNSTGGAVTIMQGESRGYVIEVDQVTGTAKVRRL